MRVFYKAFDKSGKASAGTTDAASLGDAKENLRRQGLFVTEINAAAEGSSSGAKPLQLRKGRVGTGQRLKNLAMFSRQLHVLISSGTPIVQAISAIERQCEHETWRAVVADLRQRVEEGTPLSEAMRHQPQCFDAVCQSLAAAGESSGNLPVMLDRLAVLTRKQLHLRSSVLGAMVYPCVLMGLGSIVLIVMLLFVIPRFSGLFASLDSPLPPTTKMLMWLSKMLWSYGWVMILVAGACGAGVRYWIIYGNGRRILATATLNLPKFGKLWRSLMTAKLSRMLGTLLESRVPLIEALQLTRQGLLNVHYANLLDRAEHAVSHGEPISSIFGNNDLIVACVQEAVRNGEASGQIGKPMLQMADFLDEENDVIVKSLTSIIEPAILIVLGVIVGFIALSMFLPLFDLVSAAHGGG